MFLSRARTPSACVVLFFPRPRFRGLGHVENRFWTPKSTVTNCARWLSGRARPQRSVLYTGNVVDSTNSSLFLGSYGGGGGGGGRRIRAQGVHLIRYVRDCGGRENRKGVVFFVSFTTFPCPHAARALKHRAPFFFCRIRRVRQYLYSVYLLYFLINAYAHRGSSDPCGAAEKKRKKKLINIFYFNILYALCILRIQYKRLLDLLHRRAVAFNLIYLSPQYNIYTRAYTAAHSYNVQTRIDVY